MVDDNQIFIGLLPDEDIGSSKRTMFATHELNDF
jgi:hypothetical protein